MRRSRSGVVATVGSAPMATWISASLPTYAAEFMDPFMDQQAADVPYMFEVLFFAVVMYTTVMMLYLWMTNFLEQVRPLKLIHSRAFKWHIIRS